MTGAEKTTLEKGKALPLPSRDAKVSLPVAGKKTEMFEMVALPSPTSLFLAVR
jgi:hypothetical protein